MFKERGIFSQGVLKTYGGVAVKKGQFRALSIVTETFCWMLNRRRRTKCFSSSLNDLSRLLLIIYLQFF
jgi:hypothetical protein